MEKPLMRSLKDSRSGTSQTTVCSFVYAFFHVVSNSLHIPWGKWCLTNEAQERCEATREGKVLAEPCASSASYRLTNDA